MKNNKGLTLVESMIAILILSGLFLGGMTVSKLLAESSRETERELFLSSFMEELRFHLRSKVACQLNLGDVANRTGTLIPRDDANTFKLNRILQTNNNEFLQFAPTPSTHDNGALVISDFYLNQYNDNRKEARLNVVFQTVNDPNTIFNRSFVYKINNPANNDFTCENQDEAFTNALLNEVCDRVCDQAISCPSETVAKCQQAAQINIFRMRREICEQIGSWDPVTDRCLPLFANKGCTTTPNSRIVGWNPSTQEFICKSMQGAPTGPSQPISPTAADSCNDPYYVAQIDVVQLKGKGIETDSQNARVYLTQLMFEQAYLRRSSPDFATAMAVLNGFSDLQEFLANNNCMGGGDGPKARCERVYLNGQSFLLPILVGNVWIGNGAMRSYKVANQGSIGASADMLCDNIDCTSIMSANSGEPYNINNLALCEEQ